MTLAHPLRSRRRVPCQRHVFLRRAGGHPAERASPANRHSNCLADQSDQMARCIEPGPRAADVRSGFRAVASFSLHARASTLLQQAVTPCCPPARSPSTGQVTSSPSRTSRRATALGLSPLPPLPRLWTGSGSGIPMSSRQLSNSGAVATAHRSIWSRTTSTFAPFAGLTSQLDGTSTRGHWRTLSDRSAMCLRQQLPWKPPRQYDGSVRTIEAVLRRAWSTPFERDFDASPRS